jgi:alpha-methylacyl-CoA racemase
LFELAGIGPAPVAGMMLADHGATVIRIERKDRPPVIRTTLTILPSRSRFAPKAPAGQGLIRHA